jgi:hypothetical protein
MYNISFEYDNFYIKIGISNNENKIELFKYKLLLSKTENSDSYLYLNHNFIVGENKNNLIFNDLLKVTEVIPLFIYDILKRNNIKIEEVDMIQGNFSLFNKEIPGKIKNLLSKFYVDEKEISFKNIKLNPKISVFLNYFKKYVSEEPENYLLIDLSFHNIDILEKYQGEINKQNIKSVDKGSAINFFEMLKKTLITQFQKEFNYIELIKIFNEGNLVINEKQHNVEKIIENIKEQYTKNLLTYILKLLNKDLKEYQKVIFSGDYTKIISKLNNKIIILEENEFSNIIGSLIK